jgi:hypothetical protein
MKQKKLITNLLYTIFIKALLCLFIPATVLNAGVVNIITDSDTATIKINKQVVATGVLTNHVLNNGSYYIEVYENETKLYSKLEKISSSVKTINVSSDKAPLLLDSLTDSRKRASYIFSQKSRFGMGFHLDYTGLISGLNLSLNLFGLEHQLIGFAFETDESTVNTYKYRLIKYLPGQLKDNTYFRPYTGIGIGGSNNSNVDFSTKRSIYEGIIGIQFGFLEAEDEFSIEPVDVLLGLICPPLLILKKGSHLLGGDDNLLFHIETGYSVRHTTTNDPAAWGDYKGLKIGAGITYQF